MRFEDETKPMKKMQISKPFGLKSSKYQGESVSYVGKNQRNDRKKLAHRTSFRKQLQTRRARETQTNVQIARKKVHVTR